MFVIPHILPWKGSWVWAALPGDAVLQGHNCTSDKVTGLSRTERLKNCQGHFCNTGKRLLHMPGGPRGGAAGEEAAKVRPRVPHALRGPLGAHAQCLPAVPRSSHLAPFWVRPEVPRFSR